MLVCSHISQLRVPIRMVRSKICFENAQHQTPKQVIGEQLQNYLSATSDLTPNSEITAHLLQSASWVPSVSSKRSPSLHLEYFLHIARTMQSPQLLLLNVILFCNIRRKRNPSKASNYQSPLGFSLAQSSLFNYLH